MLSQYTLSGGRTCIALVWHSRGRAFESRLVYNKSCELYAALTPCNTWSSGATAHEGGGATSQLDQPSLTPLSVAGCGRLQLGVPHWATSEITASS